MTTSIVGVNRVEAVGGSGLVAARCKVELGVRVNKAERIAKANIQTVQIYEYSKYIKYTQNTNYIKHMNIQIYEIYKIYINDNNILYNILKNILFFFVPPRPHPMRQSKFPSGVKNIENNICLVTFY